MLLLTSITDLLQVVTGQAVTIDVHASWVDNAAGTITPGRTNTAISTATTTTVVGSPGASTQRNLQTLIVRNRDAAASCDVTIKHTDGTTALELFKVTLLAGYELQYLDGIGLVVFNTLGQAMGQGATGIAGAAGAIGVSLPPSSREESEDDGFPGLRMPSCFLSRAQLSADARGWSFLGTATGATTTVGPVVWLGTFRQLMIKYQIAGYNGGTPVGRLQLGAASISQTALNNSFSISEGVAAPTTGLGATAIPGLPLAVTLSAIGRSGTAMVDGASGAVKVIDVVGNNVTPAVASAPTLFRGASFFSDLGTNLPIQRAQLTVYDTLTAVAASAQTFTAGTYLSVWGRNTD